MLKNFFVIAVREFKRNKVFALINILGLSIGISAALVIYLIVHHELSYEKSWVDGNRIYRVVTNMHFPDADFKNSGVAGPLPDAMRKEIPGIQESSRFWSGNTYKVTPPSNQVKPVSFKKQKKIILADNHYFKLFPYEWIAGSVANALEEPNKVVLTESRAKLYFPNVPMPDVIGKVLTYDDSVHAVVSGIVRDLDAVTDFTFEEFISISTYAKDLKENGGEEWGSVNSASQFFVKLDKGADPKKIDSQFPAFRKAHTKSEHLDTENFLQPLSDIHFNQDFDNFEQRLGHKPTLYGLLAVGAFLLLLGCINFINLTTAQATRRAKEIGIRKTMGSSKGNLVLQFMSENLLMTIIATIVSILLTPWILKIFADYIPEGLHFELSKQPGLFVFIPLLILLVSICSGIYPALVLSRYQPAMVLKNVMQSNPSTSRRAWIRKTLTVSQFVIAQFFIIATVMVGKQIRFTLNKDLGFKKDAIVNFYTPFDYQRPDKKQFVLQQKLKSISGIQAMSLAGNPPASSGTSIQTMKFNKDGKEIETSVEVKQADTNYLPLYKIKLLAGRNLQQSDTLREYLVNEAYTKFLGFKHPAEIVGKSVSFGTQNVPIVGVVADVHTKSLHQAIHPVAITCQAQHHHMFHIALKPGNPNNEWKSTIAQIQAAWKQVYPEDDFEYNFLDETIAKFYKKEQDTERLLNWCTGLAIFISCLGLLGLVMYTTAQRTKEIGVRKVLGAKISQIVSLISKDFMQLILIAFLIAVPLGWLAMKNWLQNFSYRTQMAWWVFIASGLVMFLIALTVLTIQIVRSASINPVKSLRSE
jgi:putative ABC transport system permease protein